MKSIIQKKVLGILMTAAPLMAFDFIKTTESLFAVEGGYSTLHNDVNDLSQGIINQNNNIETGHFGLKLGAQGRNYRVFLSGRNYISNSSHTILTAGGEAQYKFNFSKLANFFLGVSAGVAQIKIAENNDATTSTRMPYYGGDVGFNYCASELIDLELGVKYMRLSENISQGTTLYNLSDMSSMYGSIIIKWQMD